MKFKQNDAQMTLSPEQIFMKDLVTQLGCITYSQAEYMLMEYFDCSPNQAERVIQSLVKKGTIAYQGNREYILLGSKLVHSIAPISRNIVEALYVALDCIRDNNDGIEAIVNIKKTKDNDGIIFLSGDTVYRTAHASDQQLSKINFAEQIYQETKSETINLFIFSAGTNEEYIKEQLGKSRFTMPNGFVFMKTDNLFSHPEYTIYQC